MIKVSCPRYLKTKVVKNDIEKNRIQNFYTGIAVGNFKATFLLRVLSFTFKYETAHIIPFKALPNYYSKILYILANSMANCSISPAPMVSNSSGVLCCTFCFISSFVRRYFSFLGISASSFSLFIP